MIIQCPVCGKVKIGCARQLKSDFEIIPWEPTSANFLATSKNRRNIKSQRCPDCKGKHARLEVSREISA